jgi:leucyl-tRNA synthetase
VADYSKEEIKKIEKKWQEKWEKDGVYKVSDSSDKPKYYVLDMFPYPSGAGLHVGHPLGYIASDIVARYKRIKGFNVLHPMGFDAFGLPAEQYAIQTGQHPEKTTRVNIETYKRQLKQIGFSYDWSREVQTSNPSYYKWTQWIFMQLFNAWYNKKSEVGSQKLEDGSTEPIETLIAELEKNGNKNVIAVCDEDTPTITAEQWKNYNETEKENFLQKYRIAYQSETMVNWCAALGTVLSNDEVKDGVSERGGYPVERIKMLQWSMRITAYADRLLKGLDTIDWPEPVKEMQRNWIGKSVGCELEFKIQDSKFKIDVFTTRIDTIYGVTFMVLAPEHELVDKITTPEQRAEIAHYVEVAKNRSERERMSEVKRITGAFTGAYAVNPFSNTKVPVWIADYVLAGYGTGAVMAVPSSDTRDYAFAKHFNLPIINVLEGATSDITKDNFDPKSGTMINSDFLNGLDWKIAIEKALEKVESLGIGTRKINFRLRDAIFGRQRYWGEPFPVYYKDGLPHLVEEEDLPITLPEIDEYKPTESGEPPLARAKDWKYTPSLTPNPSPGERGIETADKKVWHILKEFGRDNRKNPTDEEAILWENVRNSKLGHKIRRQHTIGTFIADFACLDKQLVIEVDGEYHLSNREFDEARTVFLNSKGFEVIRFTNAEVKNDLKKVLASIKNKLDKSTSIKQSNSLSLGEGRGEAYPFELTTMPGWAGSSWYWFRYMDPHNTNEFCAKDKQAYWKDVDLYMGGSEHATGHLLYSRFWCKALKDLGFVDAEEPFKKLINQGHIQGVSKFVYRGKNRPDILISFDRINDELTNDELTHLGITDFSELGFVSELHVDISLVENDILNLDGFKNSREEYKNVKFILSNDGKYHCGSEVEKMSKSKYNVVNPDEIVNNYGADTLRLYEMFLGPLELSKPWNTQGIDGVYKFLRRFWNLFHDKNENFVISNEEPTREELKVLHKTLKKVAYDIEHFSFNTSVSEFMICTNELSSMKCNKRAILEPLCIALSPYAPHITEELWEKLGHDKSILNTSFPVHNEEYLTESSHEYPISINGKVRAKMNFALDMPKEDIEKIVLASETVLKWSEGKPPKKVIVVPGKIVNVVL